MKKLLSVLLAVMMVMTSLPTFAVTGNANGPAIPEGAILIFAEDFESGFSTGVNLLETDGAVEFFKDGKKTLKISQPAGTTAGYVAKVGAADGFEGNALYLESSVQPARADGTANGNALDNNLRFDVFFDNGNAIDTKSATIDGEPNPYYGMQIVYEFDAKVSGLRERQFMKIDATGAGSAANKPLTPFQKATGKAWSVRDGVYASPSSGHGPWHISGSADLTNKATVKAVFDQTGAVDVVRTYRNGNIVVADWSQKSTTEGQGRNYGGKIKKDFVGEYYEGQTVADMSNPSNLLTYICPANNSTAKAYIDNIVVYAIPSIEFDAFNATTNVNPEEGLQVSFTQPFNATNKTFKVAKFADGADVSSAISAVEMSNDNMTATIKMDFGVLEPNTQYVVYVDDEFTSAAGALYYTNPLGITADDEWVELGIFSTCGKLDVEVAPASGNITNYDKGEEVDVTLTFSEPLAESVDFANAFTVTDETGAEIEGLVATLNDARTVGTLCLAGLELGEGEHTIKSKDNALYNEGNVKAIITYSFGTADFTAVIDPATIAQYVARSDENSEFTVVLGAATTLTDDAITAFDVTNASGEYVNGLEASVYDSGRVIVLNISNMDLVPGKYTIKSNENLVDKRGRQLEAPVVATFKVVTELSDAELIFEEDFENDYTVGANWLANGNATETIAATNGGTWVITGGNNNANNFMGVVTKDDVTDKNGAPVNYFDSNVLKVHAATADGFNFWRKPANEMDLAAAGKVLIYEFDMYTNNNYKERKFMAFNTSTTYGFQRVSGNNFYVSTGPYYQAGTANYGQPEKGNWYARATASLSTKHNVKIIVDQTHPVNSIRTYFDGEVKSAAYNSVDNEWSNFNKVAYDFYGESYTGGDTLDYGLFKGIYTAIGHDSGATVYIDNFKAYAVNTIEFEEVDWGDNSSAEFVPENGLTLQFSEKITAAELKDHLVVKAANGDTVSNAIRSVEVSADQKSALVKLDFSKLDKLTNYDLFLSFLFRSKDGAYIARDGIVDGGDVLVANFTTSDKLEVSVDNNVISGYDKGADKTVTITLSSALKSDVDVNTIFVVKDEDGNEIEGLEATISDDRKVITLQLSGLQLGNGIHTIESKQNALVNNAGIAGSVFIEVYTLDFVAVATPVSGSVLNYVEGTPQTVDVVVTTAIALEAEDISEYFEVKDAEGNEVEGIIVTLAGDKKSFTIDMSALELGVGEHTITIKEGVIDSRGRNLEFEYKFGVMPFIAYYASEVTGYVPGTAQNVEIKLTYPLNAESIANAANAFVVKNQYGSNVSGLTVNVSEDAKVVTLDLSTLDITGGTYSITSKANAFVNVKGEVLGNIAIALSTTESVGEEIVEGDTGVGPNSGVDFEGEFTSSVLLSEDFDNEGYTRNMNWLSSDSFVAPKFQITKVGKAADFVDASVSIVEDPLNPGNYVLKNVSGFKDATGTVIAGSGNYNRVKRELDDGTASVPVDDYTIVRLSTKVMIPTGGSAGIPTGDSGSIGDTKDQNYLVSLTNAGTTALNHANLRQSSGTVQYNSWLNAADSASGTSGSVATALSTDAWHTVELVFGYNPKSNGTKFKSYAVYVDGKQVVVCGGFYAKDGSDYSTIGGMMSQLVSASGSSGTTTVYYDDWSIVKMNRLLTQVNVAKEDVAEDQIIKLQLTGKLTEDSVALIEEKGLITVKDAEGNDVEATIEIDNTGANTKVVITPAYGLEYQTTYTVEIAKEYVDDRGNVIAITDELSNTFGGFNYTFETAKALGNTINMEEGMLSYDADYMHLEDTFNYTMKLNEAVGSTPVIGAVATFSEDNKLLGIDYQVFTTGEDTKAFTVSSELGAKTLKLFIWEQNEDGTMGRLMQIPDEVTSR